MQYIRFYGSNGYCGTEYEEYEVFDDDVTEDEINLTSIDFAYDNAETYEYAARGWDQDWESEEDRAEYYENALEHCGWDYISEEEYKENTY